jgi:hypothetical protein
MPWPLLWGAWALGLLAIYRACDIAVSLALGWWRRRVLDRELAADRERHRLAALAAINGARRVQRIHADRRHG